MLYDPGFTGLHLGAIAMALLFTFAAFRQPRLGRAAFAWLFGVAALVNAATALTAPELYLYYADVAVVGWFRERSLQLFMQHAQVTMLAVALLQAAMTGGIVVGGRPARAACWAMTAFLLAVAPLGVGSGFPSTVILALGSARLALRERCLAGTLGEPLFASLRATLERWRARA